MNAPRTRILCVDDEPINLELYAAILAARGYDTVMVESGAEALEKARQGVDLVLLAIKLPDIDGFEVCSWLKADPVTRPIPVVMMTTTADREARLRGLAAGVDDFLSKPVDRVELTQRVKNLLRVKEYDDFLGEHNRIIAAKVAEKTAELRSAYLDTIYRLTIAAEFEDEDTYSHIQRVSHYSLCMARALGIAATAADIIFCASPMHDIGKIGIPDSILLKPGALTPEEFTLMEGHTLIGAKILKGATAPVLKSAERFALYHHERWNGSGYPHGLKGDKIPIEGRILLLVDHYDALRGKRPYKPAFDHETTFRIITEGDDRIMPDHFDPKVLAVFRGLHREFEEIYEANQK